MEEKEEENKDENFSCFKRGAMMTVVIERCFAPYAFLLILLFFWLGRDLNPKDV